MRNFNILTSILAFSVLLFPHHAHATDMGKVCYYVVEFEPSPPFFLHPVGSGQVRTNKSCQTDADCKGVGSSTNYCRQPDATLASAEIFHSLAN